MARPKGKEPRRKPITAKVPEHMVAELEAVAEDEQRSISQLVVFAISQWLGLRIVGPTEHLSKILRKLSDEDLSALKDEITYEIDVRAIDGKRVTEGTRRAGVSRGTPPPTERRKKA